MDDNQKLDDWLEQAIMEKFPDNLDIPIGQLSIRVFLLVQAALEKAKES